MPYKNSDRFPGRLVQLVEHAKFPQGRGYGPRFESATARYNNLTYQRIMKERIVVEYSEVGKIAGLQWGEGPRLYEDAIDEENNRFYRRWKLDPEITADLESWDYTTVLHRSLVDLTHMQGFFIKFVRNRAPRVGNPGRLVRLEHIPYQKARLVYPPDGEDEPAGRSRHYLC